MLDVHEYPHVTFFDTPVCLRWSSSTPQSMVLPQTLLCGLLTLAWTRLGLSPPHVVNVRNQAKDTLQSRSTMQHQGSFKDLYCCFSQCTGVTRGTEKMSKLNPRNEKGRALTGKMIWHRTEERRRFKSWRKWAGETDIHHWVRRRDHRRNKLYEGLQAINKISS